MRYYANTSRKRKRNKPVMQYFPNVNNGVDQFQKASKLNWARTLRKSIIVLPSSYVNTFFNVR